MSFGGIEFALLAGADPGLVTSLAQPKKPQATALPPPDEPGATRHPCASALRIQQSKTAGDCTFPSGCCSGYHAAIIRIQLLHPRTPSRRSDHHSITSRFAPSQHQSGLLSAFFGLHSIGLFSSTVAGLSAACTIVLPRLSVMRTDVVMAPGAFHPVSLSRLSLAPAKNPRPVHVDSIREINMVSGRTGE